MIRWLRLDYLQYYNVTIYNNHGRRAECCRVTSMVTGPLSSGFTIFVWIQDGSSIWGPFNPLPVIPNSKRGEEGVVISQATSRCFVKEEFCAKVLDTAQHCCSSQSIWSTTNTIKYKNLNSILQCRWRSSMLTSYFCGDSSHPLNKFIYLIISSSHPMSSLLGSCSDPNVVNLEASSHRLDTDGSDSDPICPGLGPAFEPDQTSWCLNLNEHESWMNVIGCFYDSKCFKMNWTCLNYFELMSFKGFEYLWLLQLQFRNLFKVAQKLWKRLWISTATLVLVGVFGACLLAGRETWGRSGALRRVECLNSAKQRKQRKQIIPGWSWKFWTPEDSQTMPDVSTSRVLTLGALLIECLECRSK